MNDLYRPASRASRLPAWLPYAVGPVLIALLVAALAGVAVWTEQQRYRERVEVATQNIARLLDAHVADLLDKIEVFLQLTAQEYAQEYADGRAEPARIDAFLAAHKSPLPELLSLGVVDAQGQLRHVAGAALGEGESVAQQAYFARARAGAGPGLVIDGPLPAPVTGQPVLIFARGIHARDGRFLGMIYATLATEQFGKRFSELELGARGAVGLRNTDLRLVHAFPAPADGADPVGAAEVPAGLRAAIELNPVAGFYDGVNEGIERSNVYRKVRGHPFYLMVGLANDDFLAGWRANIFLFCALAGLSIALTLIACVALYRASQRQIEAINRRFSALAEASQDAVFNCDLRGVVTSWNRGAQAMLGYSADETVGQPMRHLLPPGRAEEESDLLARIARGEIIEPYQTVRMHKDGSSIRVSIAISALRDAAGAVRGVSVVARDAGRARLLPDEARPGAWYDPLTRLPTRRLLLDRLRRAQISSKRQRTFFAVLFIGLDHLRQVQDNFGQQGADQLLVEAAKRLQLALRQCDTVARIGDDEFVLVLDELGVTEGSAVDHVNTLADKILAMLEQDYLLAGRRHRGSASIGIKLLLGSDTSVEHVLKEADAAMYRVKRQRDALALGVFE